MSDDFTVPLSRDERRRVVSAIEQSALQGAEDLATRLSADLELDTGTRNIVAKLDDLTTEMRLLRWWVLGIVALSLFIQAGLTGLDLSLSSQAGSIEVSPGSVRALPSMAPTPLLAPRPPATPVVDTAGTADTGDGDTGDGDASATVSESGRAP